MKSLLQEVTDWMEEQDQKHDLGGGFAAETINAMTNYELLCEISNAIECMKDERGER